MSLRGTPRDRSGGGVARDVIGMFSLRNEPGRSSLSFRRQRGLSDRGTGEMSPTYEGMIRTKHTTEQMFHIPVSLYSFSVPPAAVLESSVSQPHPQAVPQVPR